jgi:hypothetical protein
MIDLDKLRELAREVRRWAKKNRKRGTHTFPCNLAGMCGIASTRLCAVLQKNGFNAVICYSYYHAFVQVEDYIVDVTATQFGHAEKVLIKESKKAKGFYYWEPRVVCKTPDEFVAYQQKTYWRERETASLGDYSV